MCLQENHVSHPLDINVVTDLTTKRIKRNSCSEFKAVTGKITNYQPSGRQNVKWDGWSTRPCNLTGKRISWIWVLTFSHLNMYEIRVETTDGELQSILTGSSWRHCHQGHMRSRGCHPWWHHCRGASPQHSRKQTTEWLLEERMSHCPKTFFRQLQESSRKY